MLHSRPFIFKKFITFIKLLKDNFIYCLDVLVTFFLIALIILNPQFKGSEVHLEWFEFMDNRFRGGICTVEEDGRENLFNTQQAETQRDKRIEEQ